MSSSARSATTPASTRIAIPRDAAGLRIGYLVQQFPPEVGAGPARVVEMARYWQARGARVTVLTGFPTRSLPGRPFGSGDPAYRGRVFAEEDYDGMRVLRSWLYRASRPGIGPTLLNNLSFMASSFAHAVARAGPLDVLIASSPPFFPHVAGAAAAALRRIPLVLEIRDLWPDYIVAMGLLREGQLKTRALFALERRLLRRADHVVVVTESFRRRVIGKGVDPEDVSVVSNGVDLERYYPSDEPPPLPSLERRDDEFIIGYLGTFGASQQLGSIVDAAEILAAEDPAIRVVLAGDGLERQRVVDHAATRAVPNLIFEPAIPKEHTRAFYNACDACLVPLAPLDVLQETVPSKIFEVLACGRPVLASVGGEARDIVLRSGAGAVAAPGDARAIANAARSLKALSTEERITVGRKGRDYVAQHFTRRVLADRYLSTLLEAAGPHAKGAA